MKFELRSILLAIFFFSTLLASAANDPAIVIKAMGTKSFALFITPDKSESIRVTLENSAGIVLHNDYIRNKEEISHLYNLGNLNEGNYTLIVEDKRSFYIQPVMVKGEDVIIDKAAFVTVHTPAIRSNGKYLDLDIYCEKDTEIRYEFIRNGLSFFGGQFTRKGIVQKRFNLSELSNGDYLFNISLEVAGVQKYYAKTISL